MHDTKTTIASNTTRLTECTREPRCRIGNSPLRRTFGDLGMSPRCESQLDQMEAGGGSLTSLGFHGVFINDTTEDRFLDDAKYEPVLITHCMTLVCDECFLVAAEGICEPDHIISDYAYFSLASTRISDWGSIPYDIFISSKKYTTHWAKPGGRFVVPIPEVRVIEPMRSV